MERNINRLKREYKDSSSQANIDKLNKELVDVNDIMKKNFDLLLNREGDLTSKPSSIPSYKTYKANPLT